MNKTNIEQQSFSFKSFLNYLQALPLPSKLYLILSPFLAVYILSDLDLSSPKVLTLSITFIFFILGITVNDFKKYQFREKKLANEAALFEQVEKSLAALQEAVNDIEIHDTTQIEKESEEFKIPVPECAVILGANNTPSYIIPFNLEHLATHELTALQAASNVLKKKGLSFQVLKYKQNHPFFEKTNTKTELSIKGLNQFPSNFINFN